MQRHVLAATAIAAFSLAGTAQAQTAAPLPETIAVETTKDLAETCQVVEGAPGATEALNFCYGYIIGAGQFYLAVVAAKKIDPIACAKPVPSIDAIRANFISWASANPQYAGEKALDGLWRSAAAKWPCPQ